MKNYYYYVEYANGFKCALNLGATEETKRAKAKEEARKLAHSLKSYDVKAVQLIVAEPLTDEEELEELKEEYVAGSDIPLIDSCCDFYIEYTDYDFMIKCRDCGKSYLRWDREVTEIENSNEYICDDCLHDESNLNLAFCEKCGKLFDTTVYKETVSVVRESDEVEIYCMDCFVELIATGILKDEPITII